MKKLSTKYVFYIALICVLLLTSAVYRVTAARETAPEKIQDKEAKGKTVVTLWMKEGDDTELRKYQVNKYNKDNKDNIYIDFQAYDPDDYGNLVRISLASKKKPDIFQYGYYDLLKNKQIISIKDLGIDTDKYGSDSFMYFEGKPMGTKITGNSVKLVWNKDLFKKAGLDENKAPATWDELMNYSLKIKDALGENVVPFEFPMRDFKDLKVSIGEPSVYAGSIYTSFWDYKNGKYDFSSAKTILDEYSQMYKNGILSSNFDKKSRNDLRVDFYTGRAAMILSTYEDKNYFKNKISLEFPVGISDLPVFKTSDIRKYYYTDDFSYIVVNKDIDNKDAVKKVYEWLLDPGVNRELLDTDTALPVIMDNKQPRDTDYAGYNVLDNFSNEAYDPTYFISYNSKETAKLYIDAITGSKQIDQVIEKLNKSFDAYCKDIIQKDKIDFSQYIDKR